MRVLSLACATSAPPPLLLLPPPVALPRHILPCHWLHSCMVNNWRGGEWCPLTSSSCKKIYTSQYNTKHTFFCPLSHWFTFLLNSKVAKKSLLFEHICVNLEINMPRSWWFILQLGLVGTMIFWAVWSSHQLDSTSSWHLHISALLYLMKPRLQAL